MNYRFSYKYRIAILNFVVYLNTYSIMTGLTTNQTISCREHIIHYHNIMFLYQPIIAYFAFVKFLLKFIIYYLLYFVKSAKSVNIFC